MVSGSHSESEGCIALYIGISRERACLQKEGCMPRLCRTVEQILAKLREAEVALSKGQSWLTSAVRSVSPNKPMQ